MKHFISLILLLLLVSSTRLIAQTPQQPANPAITLPPANPSNSTPDSDEENAEPPADASNDNQTEEVETVEGNDEIENQVNGEYPILKRPGSLPVGAQQRAWDHAEKTDGVYRVHWSEYETVRIRTREATTTTIRFPTWENIDQILLGDQRFFEAKQLNDNTIEIWSKTPGADTSLKALGESGNIYSFYVRSEGWNSQHIPDLTVLIEAPQPRNSIVAILGGQSEIPGNDPTGKYYDDDEQKVPDWLKRIGFNPKELKRDILLYGDQSLAPDDAFRDNQFTYLCYGERFEEGDLVLASPYIVTDGVDRLVNFRVKHNCLIIEAIGNITLKHGDSVLCIKRDPKQEPKKITTQPLPQSTAPKNRSSSTPPVPDKKHGGNK